MGQDRTTGSEDKTAEWRDALDAELEQAFTDAEAEPAAPDEFQAPDDPALASAPADKPTEPAPSAQADASPEPAGQSHPAQAPSAPAPPATPSQPDPAPQPYTLRAYGRDLPIPDVTKLPNGDLVIPAQSFPALQMHLADGREVQRRMSDMGRQVQERTQEVTGLQQTRDALLDLFGQMLQTPPDQLAVWQQEKLAAWPGFKAQIREREIDAREARIRREAEDAERERMRPLLEPQWKEGVGQWVARLIQESPHYTGLDPAQITELAWRWKDHGLLREAPDDDPARGLKKGDMAVEFGFLHQLMGQEAERTRQQRAADEQRQAADRAKADAAARNAAAAQPAKAPAPVANATPRVKSREPVRVTRGDPPRNPDGTFKKAEDWDSFEEDFLSDGWHKE